VREESYAPERGDVVWITLNPQAGHEQAGRRPAVVLSPGAYPFEVQIPSGLAVTGAILADQVKSLDWRARDAEQMCVLPEQIIAEVLQKVGVLLR